jgi:threonine 3-dehydrogenase
MVDHMNYGGKIALLGIPPQAITVDMIQIVIKGLWLKGIYGREMFETWYKMATMLQGDLDISAVITHRFHVDQYQEAFDVMRLGQSGKVLLEW